MSWRLIKSLKHGVKNWMLGNKKWEWEEKVSQPQVNNSFLGDYANKLLLTWVKCTNEVGN